jgi:hypothetical protein
MAEDRSPATSGDQDPHPSGWFITVGTIARRLVRHLPGLAYALGVGAILLLLLGALLMSSIMQSPDSWTDVVGVLKDLATLLAILLGAAWAFYVFVLGRSFTTSVRIELQVKGLVNRANTNGTEAKDTVISVKLRNAGQTRVDRRDRCLISFEPITNRQLQNSGTLRPITNSFSSAQRSYELFEHLIGLEPNEEAEADVLVPVGDNPAIKVQVLFKGFVGPNPIPTGWRVSAGSAEWQKDVVQRTDRLRRKLNWATRMIIDVRERVEEGDSV